MTLYATQADAAALDLAAPFYFEITKLSLGFY